jgi:uncharacterized protein YgiB involved in biofilm formation
MSKKSKMVGIGLLALSIAASSCSNHKKPKTLQDAQKQDYYVNNGNGYQHGGVNPFLVYYLMSMNNGRRTYSPTYVYQTHSGAYHSSTNGRTMSVSRSSYKSSASTSSRSSVSRGGFGRSSSSHSSSSAS